MITPAPPPAAPRLLDAVRECIRVRHYSVRTERTYTHWIARYIRFHGRRHPRDLGAYEVTAFLSSLANQGHVAAATQNQALAAILFLYREVLRIELPWLTEVVRAKRAKRLPTVLTSAEVRAVLDRLDGLHCLMARLMYGTGMRITECLCLRVKDLEMARGEIVVRHGKGGRDRITMLPSSLVEPLRGQLDASRRIYEMDRQRRVPGVELPFAYARKNPGAGRSWGWH